MWAFGKELLREPRGGAAPEDRKDEKGGGVLHSGWGLVNADGRWPDRMVGAPVPAAHSGISRASYYPSLDLRTEPGTPGRVRRATGIPDAGGDEGG